MMFAALLSLTRRRWRLALAVLLVAVALGAGGALAVSPSYEAKADLLLLPSPVSAGDGTTSGNPYLALGMNLSSVVNVLSVTSTTDGVVKSLGAKGATAAYTVAPDAASSAPMVVIDVTGPDRGAVTRTLDAVEDVVQSELRAAQQAAHAPPNTFITASEILKTKLPIAGHQAAIRTGIIAFVVGLLAGGTILILVDRRSRGRDERDAFLAEFDDPIETHIDDSSPAADMAGGGRAAASADVEIRRTHRSHRRLAGRPASRANRTNGSIGPSDRLPGSRP